MPGIKNKYLQHIDNQKHSERSPDHTRQQKIKCAGFIGPEAKSGLKITVDRSQIQPVVEWQQNGCNHCITKHIAKYNHHIRKSGGTHPAGNRHECDPRHGGADHAICHDEPRRCLIADEKASVGRFACSKPCNDKQDGSVGEETKEYDGGIQGREGLEPGGEMVGC